MHPFKILPVDPLLVNHSPPPKLHFRTPYTMDESVNLESLPVCDFHFSKEEIRQQSIKIFEV